ncbi:hypothetical protein SynSYN20_00309 [Synechococcus sp. SYN20]|nr:hypothetical protein SynSYN20_00309 [Synechococcus sp. SYN20]
MTEEANENHLNLSLSYARFRRWISPKEHFSLEKTLYARFE